MNILSNDLSLYIISFLQTADKINFLNTSTEFVSTYKTAMPLYIIKQQLHTNHIFSKYTTYYDSNQKKIFNVAFYENIPDKIRSIYDGLAWFHIYLKLFEYYNISYFMNNGFLMTTKVKLGKYEIYDQLKSRVANTTSSIISPNTQTPRCWYHQLSYEEFVNISYDIFSGCKYI